MAIGAATTSAALVGHAGGRWRLLAHAAAPSSTDLDALLYGILERVRQADRELLEFVGAQEKPQVGALVADLARLSSRSSPPRRIAVLAGSRRQRRRLEEVASRAGWLVVDDACLRLTAQGFLFADEIATRLWRDEDASPL